MILFVLVLLSILAMPEPALADIPPRVKIRLFESHAPASRLAVDGPFRIVQPRLQVVPPGQYFFVADGRSICLQSAFKNRSFRLVAKRFSLNSDDGIAMQYSTSKLRRYAGTIDVSNVRGMLEVQNSVPTRDYIMSVVGSESNPIFPVESLKAQAILTQTRVYKTRPEDVVGDSTQQESYFGMDYVSPAVRTAVDAVWGQILTYNGQTIQIFYHSTCAGGTSDAAKIFGSGASNLPYMRCVPCRFCQSSPFWKPTVTYVPRAEFLRQFDSLPEFNSVDCAKRPVALTIRKGEKAIDTSGYQFWIKFGQKFGWDKAPGLRFKLTAKGEWIEVESTGAGHGVGMCQWGAAGMAERGKTCAQILNFYFPGTKIRKL